MIRTILLSAAAIPVAVALSSQNRSSVEPAGTLAEAALARSETPASIWWADYDADGLEDALAITGAGQPQLLQNLGDGQFANATRSAGLAGVSGARFAAWGDVDGDGAPDLYVGTAAGPRLFVNQRGGAFVEAAARSGLGHTGADRDAHFLDYDHDRLLDLHVQSATGDLLYRGIGAGQFQRVELDIPTTVAGAAVVVHAHGSEPAPAAPAASEGDEAARGGRASGASERPGSSSSTPANPVATRQPAPTPPGSYASVPCAFVNASASSVFDQTTNQCLLASSQGTLGNLYPLSTDFNVNAAGNVGMGVNNAADRLHVRNGDIRVDGSAGREILLLDGAGASAFRMNASPTGSSNVFTTYRQGSPAIQTLNVTEGQQFRVSNTASSSAVLSAGTSAQDDSGFIEVNDRTGATMIRADANNGGASSSNGLLQIRSIGSGGPGGVLRIQNNSGNSRIVMVGGGTNGAGSYEMFDGVGSRTILMDGDAGSGATFNMYNDAGTVTIKADSDLGQAGDLRVYNGITTNAKIVLDGNGDGDDDGGGLTVRAADGSNTVFLDGEAANSGGMLSLRDDVSRESVQIRGDDGNNAGEIRLYDRGSSTSTMTLFDAEEGSSNGPQWNMWNPNGSPAAAIEADGNALDTLFLLYDGDGSRSYEYSGFTQRIRNAAGVTTISHNGQTGAKSAVQMTDSYGQRLLYCMESPEVWFEDFGSASLVKGSARVELDPVFLETITIDDDSPMHVFVTPKGACNGMWVETFADHFVVHELGEGTSSVAFSWRLVAKRKGLEHFRLDPYVESTRDPADPANPAGSSAPRDGLEPREEPRELEALVSSRTAGALASGDASDAIESVPPEQGETLERQ